MVRSTAASQRFASEAPDLNAIASEMGVDVIVTGTLLRAGEQVRVATQLLEAPGGAVVCSHTAQVQLTDIFKLQDDLAHQIVQSLAIPLSARDQRVLGQNFPVNARAYDLYLRANHLSANTSNRSRLTAAKELYEQCLREDPHYAPAWARLGRVHRVLGKYGAEEQERSIALAGDAFRKALEINPDLPVAHNFYTYYEIEEQGRAPEAMAKTAGTRIHRLRGPASLRGARRGMQVLRTHAGLDRGRPPGTPDRSGHPDQRALHVLGTRGVGAGGAVRRRGDPDDPERSALDAAAGRTRRFRLCATCSPTRRGASSAP